MRDLHQFKLLIFIIAALIFSLLIVGALYITGVDLNIANIFVIIAISFIFVTTLYMVLFFIDKNFLKQISAALEKVSKGELTGGKISYEGAIAIEIKKN
ncbi:MAG: hypothetical protein ACK4YF_08475, partial [Exilispira sp.]